MLVEIRAVGGLEKYVAGAESGKVVKVEVPAGITIEKLLDREGIPGSEVYFLLLNGKYAKREVVLNPGDQLTLFPLIEGG